MLTITGASGQLGRQVIAHLLQQVPAGRLIATTRHPERLADLAAIGVTVRHADFTDPSTLPVAFAGTTRLLIISTDDLASGTRADQHRAAVEAAAIAGVAHIAYTSIVGADPDAPAGLARDHGLTEVALAASGVPWTALRNNFYTHALLQILGPSFSEGTLVLPEGDARTSWVTREDCARVAAAVLAGTTDATGPVDVTGPEGLSLAEVGAQLPAILGRAVPVRAVSAEQYVAQLVDAGLPGPAAAGLGGFVAAVARRSYGAVSDTVERVTGTPATPVAEVLRALTAA
jgi:NAD(P)H dehydrogenase (quinone)